MKTDGEKLKLLIRGSGLSQAEAADKMGVSRQTLNGYFHRAELPKDVLQNVKDKLGLILSIPDKFAQITTDLRQQPHTNAAPILNRDQESVLLMAINSSTYANTELLCRALAILENRPLAEIKKEATELTRERARRVEAVLDQLTLVSSTENKNSDSN